MFATNPFSLVSDVLPPLAMQVYIVLMVLAVVIGTLFDVAHKGSARFFALRRAKSNAAAQRRLGGGGDFLARARNDCRGGGFRRVLQMAEADFSSADDVRLLPVPRLRPS